MSVRLAVSPGIISQATLFWSVFGGAVVVWFFYDLLRLWRRILPRGTIWIGIEDIVFFCVCALIWFAILFPQSLGQLKGFMILAFGAGTLAYRMLVGRFLIRAGNRVIYAVKRLFRQRLQKKKKIKENSTNTH